MGVKLYWCGCRCGCSTVIVSEDNAGCTFCMEDNGHKRMLLQSKINLEHQFNPLTEVRQ